MFLTKQYFEDSMDILLENKNLSDIELKNMLYEEYAKEVFEDYSELSQNDKNKILAIVSEDISGILLSLYTFN